MMDLLMVIMNLLKGDDGPVHGEEEMVDADGDGIPLRGVEAARTKSFTCFQPNHDHNPSLHHFRLG